MRIVIQRVSSARVSVGDQRVGEIGRGVLALVGVAEGGTDAEAQLLARKLAALRIFPEGDRPFHGNLAAAARAVLVVSQFTLLGDVRRGNRPSWTRAADPATAEPLVEAFATALEQTGIAVERGRFGADMSVDLTNDGPVTLVLDSDEFSRLRSG